MMHLFLLISLVIVDGAYQMNQQFILGNTTRNQGIKPGFIGARQSQTMVLHPNNSLYVFGGRGYDASNTEGKIIKLNNLIN